MKDWGSNFFDFDSTEGFTFVAKNSQHSDTQDEE